MSTITHDFTGSYDWPAEEAAGVAADFGEFVANGYTPDELAAMIQRERAHWTRVFGSDDQGREDMARFVEVFNAKTGYTM